MLSLLEEDFVDGTHAPAAVSCGLPFLVVPLVSADAVRRARVRMDAWAEHLAGHWAAWPMVFALSRGDESPGADESMLPAHVRGCDVRARVFVPGSTVPEDPATGSANACLAAYLAARTPRDGVLNWEVAQGIEMGRPSRLSIEANKTGGAIDAVRVGGATVMMSEGVMSLIG